MVLVWVQFLKFIRFRLFRDLMILVASSHYCWEVMGKVLPLKNQNKGQEMNFFDHYGDFDGNVDGWWFGMFMLMVLLPKHPSNEMDADQQSDAFDKCKHMGVSKIGAPQNGWFIMENPIKMDDLGVPPFQETPIYCNIYRYVCSCCFVELKLAPTHSWSPYMQHFFLW